MNTTTPMKEFYGTKRILAIPMTRGAYNQYRGWVVPANENPHDAGYLVEYTDGGKPNDERHSGYISWSPADVFDLAYKPINAMTFGHALEALKEGRRVARAGWNGKGMYLLYVGPQDWNFDNDNVEEKEADFQCYAFIVMKTADNKFVPWLASQTDVLAEDWTISA